MVFGCLHGRGRASQVGGRSENERVWVWDWASVRYVYTCVGGLIIVALGLYYGMSRGARWRPLSSSVGFITHATTINLVVALVYNPRYYYGWSQKARWKSLSSSEG